MLSENQIEQFNKDGYLIIENFLNVKKCDLLRQEIDKIIDSNNFLEEVNKISVFQADKQETKSNDLYFLTSTDKIRPFLEKGGLEIWEKAKKNNDPESKKSEKNIFNKIGHALHALNPTFKEVTFDQNVKDIVKSIGYKKPVVCQSMYIFKQPFIGGEVQPHQDGTYLHVEPLRVLGIWIALEDCTTENGCLSFIPGSHKGALSRRMFRNPNKEEFDAGKFLIHSGEQPEYKEENFVSAPVKAGSAILIDGVVVHRSSANLSPKSRHIYTFHVYESEDGEFSKDNWMEFSPISFLPLYEN